MSGKFSIRYGDLIFENFERRLPSERLCGVLLLTLSCSCSVMSKEIMAVRPILRRTDRFPRCVSSPLEIVRNFGEDQERDVFAKILLLLNLLYLIMVNFYSVRHCFASYVHQYAYDISSLWQVYLGTYLGSTKVGEGIFDFGSRFLIHLCIRLPEQIVIQYPHIYSR